MADIFTKQKRRQIMQSVRRKGTEPEELLRRVLVGMKLKFLKHPANLPGRPDFYLPATKTAAFVHGCFWHGHKRCNKGLRLSKTNSRYWRIKIERNQRRDRRVARELRLAGISVYTVWECELKKGSLPIRLLKKCSL
jgi:DNA mismatch endonuclease (patch repair protein)